jgi:hypothetical protein
MDRVERIGYSRGIDHHGSGAIDGEKERVGKAIRAET